MSNVNLNETAPTDSRISVCEPRLPAFGKEGAAPWCAFSISPAR